MTEPEAVTPPVPRPAGGANEDLTAWERRGLVLFLVVVVAFAGLVEMRAALMERRRGDLDCFLRAAWAVRSGADLYAVTDDNGFHYNYPPLLAVLAAPLADPPAGADRTGMLPFGVSVVVWYALSLLCLVFAAHRLAGALEGAGVRPGCRRWWALRFWPVLGCLIPIGHTLMRGQSNLMVLALLCGSLAALLRGRRFVAGLWLSGAICIKIIPAFLLLFPLWRRDGRGLLGCAVGLALGLGVIPALALGPARTWDCYRELTTATLKPGLGAGSEDDSRATELTNVNATDSQSILVVLHNTRYPVFARRPARASVAERAVSCLLGGLLTLLTLLAAGWKRDDDPVSVVLLFGGLVLNMLFLSPVCHLHYFSLALPLVMVLMVVRWEGRGTLHLGAGLLGLLIVSGVANLLPHLPSLVVLRDGGLALYGALLLWAAGAVVLWWRRRGRSVQAPALPQAERRAA